MSSSLHRTTILRRARGNTVILQCHCNCTQSDERWRKDGVILSSGSTVVNHTGWTNRLSIQSEPFLGKYDLQITTIRPDDTGEYVCEIQNGQNFLTETVTLIIYGLYTTNTRRNFNPVLTILVFFFIYLFFLWCEYTLKTIHSSSSYKSYVLSKRII